MTSNGIFSLAEVSATGLVLTNSDAAAPRIQFDACSRGKRPRSGRSSSFQALERTAIVAAMRTLDFPSARLFPSGSGSSLLSPAHAPAMLGNRAELPACPCKANLQATPSPVCRSRSSIAGWKNRAAPWSSHREKNIRSLKARTGIETMP